MMPPTEPECKARKVRCFVCNNLDYKENFSYRPIVDQRQRYVCSEKCWREYLEQLAGWYL